MSYQILELLAEHLEKQDLLSKLTERELLHGYGYSEIHCIDAIGMLPKPNVTKIANCLNMSRGAISRLAKKQIAQGLIESYSSEENKKELYFRLTKKGEALFIEHKKRHTAWKERDSRFFNQYSEDKISEICIFFEAFNAYLKEQIDLVLTEKRQNNVD